MTGRRVLIALAAILAVAAPAAAQQPAAPPGQVTGVVVAQPAPLPATQMVVILDAAALQRAIDASPILQSIKATGDDSNRKLTELHSTAGEIGMFFVKYVIPPLVAAVTTWQVTK